MTSPRHLLHRSFAQSKLPFRWLRQIQAQLQTNWRWSFSASHPPLPHLLLASVFAWCVLLMDNGWLSGSIRAMDSICRAPIALDNVDAIFNSVTSGMRSWSLMVIAMMLPLTGEAMRHVSKSSPWETRSFNVLTFILSYLGTWIVVGITLHLMSIAGYATWVNSKQLSSQLLPVLGFIIAAIWVWSPAKRNAQLSCAKTIAIRITPIYGILDSARYGLVMGWACIRSCWPPMVALLLAEHGMWMMIIVASLLMLERFYLSHKSYALGYAWIAIAIYLSVQIIQQHYT